MVSEHSVKVWRAAGNLFLKNFKSKYIQEIIGLRMLALDGVNRLLFQQSVLQLCRGFDLDQTQEILSMMQHKPAVIEPLVESVVDKLIVNLYGIAVHLLRQRGEEDLVYCGVHRRICSLDTTEEENILDQAHLIMRLLKLSSPAILSASRGSLDTLTLIRFACKTVSNSLLYVGTMSNVDTVVVDGIISRYTESETKELPVSIIQNLLDYLQDSPVEAEYAWDSPAPDPTALDFASSTGEESPPLLHTLVVAAAASESLNLGDTGESWTAFLDEVKRGDDLSKQSSSMWELKKSLEQILGNTSMIRRNHMYGRFVNSGRDYPEIDELWNELAALDEVVPKRLLSERALALHQESQGTTDGGEAEDAAAVFTADERAQLNKTIKYLKAINAKLRINFKQCQAINMHVQKRNKASMWKSK